MNPDATRNLLIRRRELTGETFNDQTIQTWHDLLKGVDYREAVDALNQAAVEHERVNARHLHEQLPARQRPSRGTIGAPDCLECEALGWVTVIDEWETHRLAPCATCRPEEHRRDMAAMRAMPEPVWTRRWREGRRLARLASQPVPEGDSDAIPAAHVVG